MRKAGGSLLGLAMALVLPGIAGVVLGIVFLEKPLGLVLLIAGIALLIAAALCILLGGRGSSAERRLKKKGERVYAQIKDYYRNTAIKVDGRSPCTVRCEYTDPRGKLHIYKSGNYFGELNASVRDKFVAVYVSKDDPTDYFVDMASLSEK